MKQGPTVKRFWRDLLSWLQPTSVEQETARQENFTKASLLLTFIVILLITGIVLPGWLLGAFDSEPLVYLLPLNIIVGGSLYLARRGLWKLGAIILVMICFGLGALLSFLYGFYTNGVLFYALSITLALFLVGGAYQWVMVFVSIVFHTVFGFRLSGDYFESFSGMIVFSSGLIGLGLLQSYVLAYLKTSISLASQSVENLHLEIRKRESAQAALRKVVQNMPVMLIAFDESKRIIAWNRECERVTGYLAEEIIGRQNLQSLHTKNSSDQSRLIPDFSHLGNHFRDYEVEFTCKDGNKRVISWSNLSALFPIPGWQSWQVGVDITERRKTEDRLKYLSSHDQLTGLYNRHYYDQEASRLQVSRLFPVSIVFIDVDQLKMTNDRYGHEIGDEVLVRSALVLRSTFRAEDVIARIGGDEFAVLLPETDEQVVQEAVQRLRENVKKHNNHSPAPPISLSIGWVTAREGDGIIKAMSIADRLMYKDKQARRDLKME